MLAVRVVDEGWTLTAAAEAAGVSVRCARKWVGRYAAAGEAGLVDRSSAPRRVANRTPAERVAVIVELRRLRMTAAEIAETLAMPLSTVSADPDAGSGMGRLGRLGLEPAVRYERSRPGELVHIDVKKLGRIEGGAGRRVARRPRSTTTRTLHRRAGRPRRDTVGWEYVHIAVDDYSRLAYAEVLADEKATTAVGFLRRAVAFYRRYGIQRRTRAHRQRLRLPLDRPRPRLPPTRHPPPPHPPLPPTDKRQSRTLHPHPARRLGLRRHLPLKPTNAPPPLTAGSGTTTIDADTQPSATNPRSAEPTCSGPTSSAAGAAARCR